MQRRTGAASSVFRPGCSFIVILGGRSVAVPSICLPKLCGGRRISGQRRARPLLTAEPLF